MPYLIGDVIPEEDLWDCTTCRSCEEQCPIFIEHVDKTIDMRRNLVLMESRFPPEAQLAFRNMENNSNPWGIGWSSRGDFLKTVGCLTLEENPEAEILYFPGCSGSFDARNQKVSAALVKLLKAAEVNFAILGSEEKCCGDSARRLGNEYLFQALAQENIETMNGYGVKTIITQCPHCFNTLKNEYPEFGGNYQVLHHTEYLNELLASGRLKLNKAGGGSERGLILDPLPITIPVILAAITQSTQNPEDYFKLPASILPKWLVITRRVSAAVQVAEECGWKSIMANVSMRCARTKPWQQAQKW